MSINKLISIKNAIVDATDMAGIDHGNFLPLFMTWAVYAEKEIGGMSAIDKYAIVDINCGIANIPCDAVEVYGAILGKHDCNCGNLFKNMYSYGGAPVRQVFDGGNFLVVDIGGSDNYNYSNYVSFGYQDNKLIFDNNCIKDGYVTIHYRGLVEDCEGFPLVSENHILAIAEYIRYCWLKRKRKKSQSEYREMQDAYIQWDRLCPHARADDNMITESQRLVMVATLHDAYARISLSQGMKLNNYGRIGF